MPTCPRCDNDKSDVAHTTRLKNGTTRRERICCQCKLIWYTLESNASVCTYNNTNMKAENMPIDRYMAQLLKGESNES